LIQRRHSADLFDFVHATFISPVIEINQKEVASTFLKMTIFSAGPRIVKDLLFNLPFDVLRGLWEEYVICPKPSIIDFDGAVEGFKGIIDSLFGDLPPMRGEQAFFPPELRNPIMEAGYGMTTLDIMYHGIEREVEPYSLKYKIRADGVGQEYLYVYDLTGGRTSRPGMKSLVHSGFRSIKNTDRRFEPKYEIELSKAGQPVLDAHFQGQPRRWRSSFFVPHKHVYQCPMCERRFYRTSYSPRLNPHNDKYGNRCFGKIGVLIR